MRVRSPTRSPAVIDEESDFAFDTALSGVRQIRLAQSGSGDGTPINRDTEIIGVSARDAE